MTESLLQYIWKLRLFNSNHLRTKTGEAVEILHQGFENHHSGPDFSDARIKIGDTVWAGHVEIHVNGNDWYAHQHHLDAAYRNVVLHVVYHTDSHYFECLENMSIPCIELQDRIPEHLVARYRQMMEQQLPFPCAKHIEQVDDFTKIAMIEKTAIERLQHKTRKIEQALEQTQNDWEQVCWQMIARYLGGSIHSDALEQTAKKISVKILAKHSDQPLQLEALIFGVSGLLQTSYADEYPNALQREFNYLKRLHRLESLNEGVFKWAKTRPANFPTIRLAQLAAIAGWIRPLFSHLAKGDVTFVKNWTKNIQINDYWKTHFCFDVETKNRFTRIGNQTVQVLLINAVLPLLFAYGKHTGNEMLTERALDGLRQIKPEQNSLIASFRSYGWKPQNALESQGMLELKHSYCHQKRCLYCSIGNSIFQQ
jgi:hypothetical protein